MSQDAPFVGIRNEGDLTLRNVAVTGNNTWGIYILGGTLNASNVSLYTSIGLVCNYYAEASITNSVITTLTSAHPVYCSSITLTNITIIGKAFYASPIITATNTIFNQGCSAPIHSLGHNIDVGNTCGLNATGDMTITNPMLTPPIMVNGMLVNALQPGSPAIDKGDDATCPITDATGFPRPYGTHCDIGAYEWRPMSFSFYFYFFPFIAR
jgi:hypothetical protein